MKRYEHVVLMGIDGGGHFFREGDTPNFDRIFADGAVTYEALTSFPSISAECWSSMFMGVSPHLHTRTNDILDSQHLPKDFPWETSFRTIRKAYPNAIMGAYCDWGAIINGLVEDELNIDTLHMKDCDLVEPICRYIRSRKPDFFFTHFDSCDHEGHAGGFGMPSFMKQIRTVDGYIGKVYDTLAEASILDSTLFMVVCDHGGTCDLKEDGSGYKGSHGGWTYNERTITFAATGKGISSGEIPEMNIRDIAAIVRYAFGLEIPDFDLNGWTSQIPPHLFEGLNVSYRDISCEAAAAPRISAIQHGTKII